MIYWQRFVFDYPTGQNCSLGLMFTNLATAKNCEKNWTHWNLFPIGAWCLNIETTLMHMINILQMVAPTRVWSFEPPITNTRSTTGLYSHLSTGQTILRSCAKHSTPGYREKTTQSRNFMSCSLSSCRVNA